VAARVTTVFVVSEVRLYREGVRELLEHDRDIRVVGAAASHRAAAFALLADPVDVIVLDTTLPEAGDALHRLGAPDQKVVVLGVVEREEDVIGWAEAGAAGYVSRDGSTDDLAETIRAVARGESLCSPHMVAALLRRLAVRASTTTLAAPPSDQVLTPRERQVADLIGEGLSNKEIAQRLCIELSTVKNHVHNILRKLDVSRRGQAAAYVMSVR
jgi:DNA-binding NarL/FixJ family response regulator